MRAVYGRGLSPWSVAIASWFAAEGRRAWAWFYPLAIPGVFMALAVLGFAIGVNPAAPAFLAMPWIWVTALAVHHQVSPPTINIFNQDPECDLDYCANTAREMRIDVALKNSFGFGGTNGTLVFKRI